MRRYLATIHKRSDEHKKRFALAVSGSFTLLMFAVWSLANFGLPGQGSEKAVVAEADERVSEVSPLDPLTRGMAAAFQALKGSFSELGEGLKRVDLEEGYSELRGKAFDNYDGE